MPKHWKMYFTKSRTNRLQVFWFFFVAVLFLLLQFATNFNSKFALWRCARALTHHFRFVVCKLMQNETKRAKNKQQQSRHDNAVGYVDFVPSPSVGKSVKILNFRLQWNKTKAHPTEITSFAPICGMPNDTYKAQPFIWGGSRSFFFNMCIRHEIMNTSRESPSPHTVSVRQQNQRLTQTKPNIELMRKRFHLIKIWTFWQHASRRRAINYEFIHFTNYLETIFCVCHDRNWWIHIKSFIGNGTHVNRT